MKLYEYILKFKDGASDKLKRIARESNKTRKQVNLVDSAFSGLKRTVAGLAIGAALFAGVKASAQLGIQMEQTRVSFTTFLKDADKANQTIAKLNEFSNVTPFDNAQVIQAGKSLLAFGTSAEKLTPTLRKIGDISAGTGKDFNELATIYGKARIAGTLYAEDINQLVEAGIPIMGEFAKALGTTEDKVKKMASEGKLKFRDLENAFTNLTSEGGLFFDLMAKQSQTVGGKISTFQGKIQTLGIGIGEALNPVIGKVFDKLIRFIDKHQAKIIEWAQHFATQVQAVAVMIMPYVSTIIDQFSKLFRWMGKNQELLKNLAIAVGIATASFMAYKLTISTTILISKGYVLATNAMRIATLLFTHGFRGLNMVMKANPVGLVIAGITALIGVVTWAWHKFDWFRGVVFGLWSTLKELGNILLNGVLKIFHGMIDTVVGFGTAVWKVLTGDLPGAIKAGKKAAKGALSVLDGFTDLNPVGIVVKHGKKLGKAFTDGYKDGVADFAKDKLVKKIGVEARPDQKLTDTALTETPAENDKLKDGIDSINGGGTKHTNINVSMDNLIGEQIYNIYESTRENIQEMEEEVEQALLRVVNGLNHAAQS